MWKETEKKERETSVSFFFNDTATTEIYTLSLHDALPISQSGGREVVTDYLTWLALGPAYFNRNDVVVGQIKRSEEHTSELQSH